MNRRDWAAVLVALAISACDNVSAPDAFASYDDCIIATVSDAPNTDAIEVLTASCARKFEQKVDFSLNVVEAVDSDAEIAIQNDSDFIITKIDIDAGDLGSWSFEDRIEPGSFINVQTPGNARAINSAAKKRSVSAKAIRAIPVKPTE